MIPQTPLVLLPFLYVKHVYIHVFISDPFKIEICLMLLSTIIETQVSM